MTLDEFDRGLLTWGSDLSLWPEDRRVEAETLLVDNPGARALIREMAAFDADLKTASLVELQDGAIASRVQGALTERIAAPGVLAMLPIRRMLGLGSLAGVGGAIVAYVVPATNTGRLLAVALGGVMP